MYLNPIVVFGACSEWSLRRVEMWDQKWQFNRNRNHQICPQLKELAHLRDKYEINDCINCTLNPCSPHRTEILRLLTAGHSKSASASPIFKVCFWMTVFAVKRCFFLEFFWNNPLSTLWNRTEKKPPVWWTKTNQIQLQPPTFSTSCLVGSLKLTNIAYQK